MKVYEYILEYIVDLHKFELRRLEHQYSDYMEYYNAVVLCDNVVRLDSPCLVCFDKVVLYSERDDNDYALEILVNFLKTYYRGRIHSTQCALDTLSEQYPSDVRSSHPLEDVDIEKGDED